MKAIVVGAGISGASAAFLLKKLNYDVLVIEKLRIGGKAYSVAQNGYVIETGPNGFLENKKEILNLVYESGFEKELIEANKESQRRFIYSKNKLWELKNNPISLLFNGFFSIGGILSFLEEPFVRPLLEDETVEDFVLRRFSKEMLNKLIGPMVCGVFAGDPSRMSMESNFPRIKEVEKEHGSLIRGLIDLMIKRKARASSAKGSLSANLLSFKNGVLSFIEHLLNGVDVVFDEIGEITKNEKFYLKGKTANYSADIIVFAIPSYALTKVFWDADREFAKAVSSVEYAPMSVLAFGFNKEGLPDIVNSFGYLFNLEEIEDIIGVLFDSSIFKGRAYKDKMLIRCMVGGALRKNSPFKSNLFEIGIKELQRSASIFLPPEFFYKLVHPKAIPQYSLGHKNVLNSVKDFEDKNKGLFITGNAFWGISLNDCVKASYDLIERVGG
ncbi:protoporphyrinogen oxidase [Hippea maritima]|uniref:Coproporphyrinogen III oxidase n=1 Tax=Hippea maritima (strain ATCC 700847 / DSM 10411 / MH2) TaxID=760142 RepID=F2LV08_HIPMA|nr:protoporphyrinogen oxidase [Hippea maritima]AEA33592.1 protoporphyrinogen oxidase [Hippea maritima DSM 10411]